jgi:hypothetical protein
LGGYQRILPKNYLISMVGQNLSLIDKRQCSEGWWVRLLAVFPDMPSPLPNWRLFAKVRRVAGVPNVISDW